MKHQYRYSLQLIISIEVNEDADVHRSDGKYDTGKGDGGELVDKLDTHEHHHAHDEKQPGAVHAEVIVHRLGVLREVPEDGQPGCHVCLLVRKRCYIRFLFLRLIKHRDHFIKV